MSANIYHPSRGGVRGGRDQFNWEDVKEDKDRENYLGHSVKAPVGRWQKGKDLMWYTRDKIGNESAEERKRKELKSIRDLEAQAMATALGYKVPQKPIIKGDDREVSNDIDKSTQVRDQKKKIKKKKEKSKKKKRKQKRKYESSESDDSYNVRTQKSQKLDHSPVESSDHKFARLKKKGRRGDDADGYSRAKSYQGDSDNYRSHSHKEEEERRGTKKGHRDRKTRD